MEQGTATVVELKGIAIVTVTGGLGEAVRGAGGRADVAQVAVPDSASVKSFFEKARAQ